MELRSKQDDLKFSVFMRINEEFAENFSIGLNYYPRDGYGTLCLLRCNGPHGDFIGASPAYQSHFQYHIHRAKAENMEAGFKAERGGGPTQGYASYKDALSFFLKEVNVTDSLEYFQELIPPGLTLNSQQKEPEL